MEAPSKIFTKQNSNCESSKRRQSMFRIRNRVRALSSGQKCCKTYNVFEVFRRGKYGWHWVPCHSSWHTASRKASEHFINFFIYFDDMGRARHPMYISRHKSVFEIDLLYFNEHYAWIKDFSRFLQIWQETTDAYFIANALLDISHWKLHSSAISSFALAKILFLHFTSFLSLTENSNLQTGSTWPELRLSFTLILN